MPAQAVTATATAFERDSARLAELDTGFIKRYIAPVAFPWKTFLRDSFHLPATYASSGIACALGLLSPALSLSFIAGSLALDYLIESPEFSDARQHVREGDATPLEKRLTCFRNAQILFCATALSLGGVLGSLPCAAINSAEAKSLLYNAKAFHAIAQTLTSTP